MYKTHYGDLASVIIPSFNHQNYVAKALDSVFAQTYPNIELIVIDDQSTDDTLLAVTDWASQPAVRQRFARLSVLRNEQNMGAHATINKGIAEAKGQLITVLNSDDVFVAGRIDKLVTAMANSGSGFAFSKVMAIDEYDKPIPNNRLSVQLVESFQFADQALQKFPSLSFGFLVTNQAISTGNMLIHSQLIKTIGGFRELLYVHDWDFALRAILETEPVYVAEALYGYRLHGSNSFRSLGGVKDIEIDALTEHFSDLVRYRPVNNKLAPTPENWPFVFESFANQLWSLRWNDFKRQQDKNLEQMTQFKIHELDGACGRA
ncbi:MAG: glycosyltransferase family 2 protein [Methylococcaceae bacterium]